MLLFMQDINTIHRGYDMDETTSTGISLPAEIMALLDAQAKRNRRKRSQQIAWLVEEQERRERQTITSTRKRTTENQNA